MGLIKRRYTFGNDKFSLEDAYYDCKLVFDGITDDDSFQEADTGLILYYANEIIYALRKALEGKGTNVLGKDCVSRRAVIDAIQKLNIPEDMCVFEIMSHIEAEIATLPPAKQVVLCKDCEWWTKQSKSLQGRCELMQMYPTGGWYCGNVRKRGEPSESYKERKKIWRKA